MNFTAADRVGAIGGYIGAVPVLANLLGGLTGNWNNCGAGCSENMSVNRYELDQQKALIDAQAEISYLRGRDAAKTDAGALRDYVDAQFSAIRDRLCDQAVHNQRSEDGFAMVRQDLTAVRNELRGEIKREAERRCCADNAIVNYSNATFYPKLVADVTAGTTTTAQMLYNPIPDCGCDC